MTRITYVPGGDKNRARKERTMRRSMPGQMSDITQPRKYKGRRSVGRYTAKLKHRPFGTFDIETQGLGGKFLDSTTYDEQFRGRRFRTVDELWNALILAGTVHQQFIWFAHNGARYDFTYLAIKVRDYAINNQVTIETIQQGTKIIGLIIPVGSNKVRIYDSFPLLQTSLKNASKAYAPDYSKLNHCARHGIAHYNPECDVCVEYMMRDAESLWFVMQNVNDLILETFGVQPGLTTGSTAIKAWMATIPEGIRYFRQSPAKEDFLRKVGAGSLTYPGHNSERWDNALTLDRTAAFAACMLEGDYPTSPGIWTRKFNRDYFGCYQVIAETPDDLTFPVIPAYTANGRKFAVGTFEAYITSDQYRLAESMGYRLSIIRGMYFRHSADIFGEFIRKCSDLEYPPDGTDANPAVKAMTKNMRNSLNGKFNIRPTTQRILIGPLPDNPTGVIPWVNEDTGDMLPGYLIEDDVDAPYCQPVWYAITVTRQINFMVNLLLMLEPDERGKVDTDSITIKGDALDKLGLDLSSGYGAFKIEHDWEWIQSLGVKNYLGRERNGKLLNYCKGIPRGVIADNIEAHQEAATGNTTKLKFDSLRSMQEMLKKGLDIPAIIRERSISTPYTSVGWYHNENNQFKPIRLDER